MAGNPTKCSGKSPATFEVKIYSIRAFALVLLQEQESHQLIVPEALVAQHFLV